VGRRIWRGPRQGIIKKVEGAKKYTHATVIIAAPNVASDELTEDMELAKFVSIVSISFPKRFSIRPV